MSRARRNSFLFLAGLAALLVGGCATQPPTASGARTVMVALRVTGGQAPSPEQVAKAHRAIAEAVTKAGLQFANHLDGADYVLSATFTPEPGDPDQGHLAITSVERVGRSRVSDARATEASFNEMRTQLRAVERWAESRSAPAAP